MQHRQRLPFSNDKALLHIFVASAFLVAFSIILVPLSIENDTIDFHHNVAKLAQPQEKAAFDNPLRRNPTITKKEDKETTDTRIKPKNHQKEDPPPTTDNETPILPEVPYHVVFSTGCKLFQDWQSYVFFYHTLQSGQEGHVTRIVSGCDPEQSKEILEIFEREIAPMAPGRFHLHLTPEYSRIKKGVNFKYFNKPYGMLHWMQFALGYPNNHLVHNNSIVILMDPDQIMLRPFTNDFTNSAETWRLKAGYKLKVEHGSPFAQQYGYGLQWKRKVDLKHVFQNQNTSIATMTDREASDYYMAMGPPYIATAKDMYSIVSTWTDIVPRVHDDYPHLLAEMFGYNLAAAHLDLRHTIAFSFMVSDVWAGGEGWDLINKVDNKDICDNFPTELNPHAIHYCHNYNIGKWFIGKYRLRKDFISCEAPLLTMPPADVALKYKRAINPQGEIKEFKPQQLREEAFMVCAMIRALNAAAVYYKDHHCDKATANYSYNYTFHDDMTMPEDIEEIEDPS